MSFPLLIGIVTPLSKARDEWLRRSEEKLEEEWRGGGQIRGEGERRRREGALTKSEEKL